jgi:hypothetical protein
MKVRSNGDVLEAEGIKHYDRGLIVILLDSALTFPPSRD